MKGFLSVMIFLTGVGCAQVSGSGNSKAPDPGKDQPKNQTVLLCKLESISWNPETEELSWVISTRDVTAPDSQPPSREKYTIHVDSAIMSFNGEGRHFDADEAQRVGELMDLISAYTVESTAWWAKGLGEKTNGNDGAPSQNKAPEKRGEDTPKPAPVLRGPAIHASFPIPGANPWLAQSTLRPAN